MLFEALLGVPEYIVSTPLYLSLSLMRNLMRDDKNLSLEELNTAMWLSRATKVLPGDIEISASVSNRRLSLSSLQRSLEHSSKSNQRRHVQRPCRPIEGAARPNLTYSSSLATTHQQHSNAAGGNARCTRRSGNGNQSGCILIGQLLQAAY